ncbi:MAG: hypothetical protein ACFFE8_04250 [Candidatus Heimdallarchaeota archaeon]
MSTCEETICTGACEACTIAICADVFSGCQCNQGPQCSPNCNPQCSGSSCRCGSSSSVILPGILGIMGFLLTGIFGIGILSSFGAKSPYVLTVLGAVGLSFSLSGIRLDRNPSQCPDAVKTRTRWRGLVINHSHHPPDQRIRGHEIRIGEKYFCTGCYGILIGTVLALLMAFFYLGIGIVDWMWPLILVGVPASFVPIILRYTVYQDGSSIFRLISNILLPVGCCLIFVIFDATSQGLTNNILLTLGIMIIALLRAFAAAQSNRNLGTVKS